MEQQRVTDELRYQPCYCEENIWWLCQEPRFASQERYVCFISNRHRQVVLWCQRAGGEGSSVVWDYHVILLVRGALGFWIWDLDTTLPLPAPAGVYLSATFPRVRLPLRSAGLPLFRVLSAAELVATFTTDRSHMKAADGTFQKPPPPWDPPAAPGQPMNLPRFIDMTTPYAGEVLDLDRMVARFAQP